MITAVRDNANTRVDAPPADSAWFGVPLSEQLPCILDGRYRLIRLLAAGHMSWVYAGEDLRLNNQPVVVNFITPDLAKDPHNVQRFHGEASRLLALRHPGIVRVIDRQEPPPGPTQYGQLGMTGSVDRQSFADGPTDRHRGGGVCLHGSPDLKPTVPWLATEMVDGYTLRLWTKLCFPTMNDRLAAAAGMAESLEAVHEAGVVHFDVKPDNVVMRKGLGRDRPVLIDFGVGLSISDLGDDERTRRLPTTSEWISSDIFLYGLDELNTQVDLQVLGYVIYWLATGRRPIDLSDLAELRERAHDDFTHELRLRVSERPIPRTRSTSMKSPADSWMPTTTGGPNRYLRGSTLRAATRHGTG
jgi:serine/threonine-protein kinase